MPKDYKSFCLVASHLVKNAHRYYKEDCKTVMEPEGNDVGSKVKGEIFDERGPKSKLDDLQQMKGECDGQGMSDESNDVHCILREIWTLKRQNRIIEQQALIVKLKDRNGSYRCISKSSGIPLKTVHDWCSLPKNRQHKATEKAKMRKEEFINFVMQDTISYSNPSNKYMAVNEIMCSS